MDALDFLSGSEEDEPDSKRPCGATAKGEGESCSQQGAQPGFIASTCQVSFETLNSNGYQPTELLQTARYLCDSEGQEARRGAKGLPQDLEKVWLQRWGPVAPEKEANGNRVLPAQPVEVRGKGLIPEPWEDFSAFPEQIRDTLVASGFVHPSKVQAYTWPILMSGRDLIGVSRTGSGKTLSYLLPCYGKLLNEPAVVSTTPSILALAPSRELVCQIEREAERFRKSTGLSATSVYGGGPRHEQLAGLRGNPQLVVATPGRLNDFRNNEPSMCKLFGVRFLILDEADRMLDDGFELQIRQIIEDCTHVSRQTMLFSATWPPVIHNLARDLLKDPVEVHIGKDALCANSNILQEVIFYGDQKGAKTEELLRLLRRRSYNRCLVFVSTKASCSQLVQMLRGVLRHRCESIHGARQQSTREAALDAFRSGAARLLVATEVAGRGLDVPGIDIVVNYDPPRSPTDYIHRIGRAGRAEAPGRAITLLNYLLDGDAMKFIAKIMQQSGAQLTADLVRRLGPALPGWKPAWREIEERQEEAAQDPLELLDAQSASATKIIPLTTTPPAFESGDPVLVRRKPQDRGETKPWKRAPTRAQTIFASAKVTPKRNRNT